eukprot:tig00020780_g13796.t1
MASSAFCAPVAQPLGQSAAPVLSLSSQFLGSRPEKATRRRQHARQAIQFDAAPTHCLFMDDESPMPIRASQVDRIKKAALVTALKTPFLRNGQIDIDTFDGLVKEQMKAGVEGLVVGGTTGEGHLMNESELLDLIQHSVEKFGDKLVIIGNTGGNNTSKALKLTKQGFAKGMHCALQINPYYGKTSDAGVLEHLGRLLAEGPGIVYNVPGRTGQDIKPAVVEKLAKNPNLMGMKECAGNDRIAEHMKLGISAWSGNDDQCFDGRHANGSGVISVASNLVPSLMRTLMDDKNATGLNSELAPLMSWLFCEPNPIAIDTVLAMTGAVQPVFRLPYVPLSLEQRQKGVELLAKVDRAAIVGSRLEVMADADFTLLDHF